MNSSSVESILKKYPQLERVFCAMRQFKETGEENVKCLFCNTLIRIRVDREKSILETNCACGKSKTKYWMDLDKFLNGKLKKEKEIKSSDDIENLGT